MLYSHFLCLLLDNMASHHGHLFLVQIEVFLCCHPRQLKKPIPCPFPFEESGSFPSFQKAFCCSPHKPAVVSASMVHWHTSHFCPCADLGVIGPEAWLLFTDTWTLEKARFQPEVQTDIGTKHGCFTSKLETSAKERKFQNPSVSDEKRALERVVNGLTHIHIDIT